MNHRRTNAPVRHCPQCGQAVNEGLPVGRCPDATHAQRRRQQSSFCIDCGAQLIAPPPGVR
jgi:predicted nucleic acid-binding Zn ribbon protein